MTRVFSVGDLAGSPDLFLPVLTYTVKKRLTVFSVELGGSTREELLVSLADRVSLTEGARAQIEDVSFPIHPERVRILGAILMLADMGYESDVLGSTWQESAKLLAWSRAHLPGYELLLAPPELFVRVLLDQGERVLPQSSMVAALPRAVGPRGHSSPAVLTAARTSMVPGWCLGAEPMPSDQKWFWRMPLVFQLAVRALETPLDPT